METPSPPLRRHHRISLGYRALHLLAPFVLVGLCFWVLWLVATPKVFYTVLTAVGVCIFGAGSTVIFGRTVYANLALDTWHLALIFALVNGVTAFVYTYNLDLLERLPRIGPYLRRARANAVQSLKRHKWIRRLATVGVGLFVVTPLPGSGALGGSLMGRILGLSLRATFLTVSIAGVVIAVLYASFAGWLGRWLDAREWGTGVRVAAAAAFLLLVWVMWRIVRRLGRPSESGTARPAGSGPAVARPGGGALAGEGEG